MSPSEHLSSADAIRSLRRGILRAQGFRLFIAVCNSPARRDRAIDLLGESLPGAKLEIVALSEHSSDPLEAILNATAHAGPRPLMIVNMEKSIPSGHSRHPVLQSLNLRRTEWPNRLARPIVLWIPEYLLALLGREAPDFLDWRSDTVYFLGEDDRDFQPFQTTFWANNSATFNTAQRLARIEELESRLALCKGKLNEPAVLISHAEWTYELGNQRRSVGELSLAEGAFRTAQHAYEQLGDTGAAANCIASIAMIELSRGNYDLAEELLTIATAMHVKTGHQGMLAIDYTGFAQIRIERSDTEGAIQFAAKAESLVSKINDIAIASSQYLNISNVYERVGDLDHATACLSKALEIERALSRDRGIANCLRSLGSIARRKGDLTLAETRLRDAIEIDERLSNSEDLSLDYGNLGLVLLDLRRLDEAEKTFLKGIEFAESFDINANTAVHYSNLAIVYKFMKNSRAAKEFLMKSVDVGDKLSIFRRRGYDFLELARLSKFQGETEDAKKFALKAHIEHVKDGDSSGIREAEALLRELHLQPEEVKREEFEKLLKQLRVEPDARTFHAAFILTCDTFKDRVPEVMQLFEKNHDVFQREPGSTLSIAVTLIAAEFYSFANEVLDVGFEISKSRFALSFHESFYWLNKLQIKAHQKMTFNKEDMHRLDELSNSTNILTRMGAAILLGKSKLAKTLIAEAVDQGKMNPEHQGTWPIFRLLAPD